MESIDQQELQWNSFRLSPVSISSGVLDEIVAKFTERWRHLSNQSRVAIFGVGGDSGLFYITSRDQSILTDLAPGIAIHACAVPIGAYLRFIVGDGSPFHPAGTIQPHA